MLALKRHKSNYNENLFCATYLRMCIFTYDTCKENASKTTYYLFDSFLRLFNFYLFVARLINIIC